MEDRSKVVDGETEIKLIPSYQVPRDFLLFRYVAEDREFLVYASGRTRGFSGAVGVSSHIMEFCVRLLQGEIQLPGLVGHMEPPRNPELVPEPSQTLLA
jgi:hypothetical protein